jgi:hypothetical protein
MKNMDVSEGSAALPAPPQTAAWALPTLCADSFSLKHVRPPPLPSNATFKNVYTLVLLIDEREQFRRSDKGDRATYLQTNLARIRGNSGICVESRTLPTGDVMWVARCTQAVPAGPAVGAVQELHSSSKAVALHGSTNRGG